MKRTAVIIALIGIIACFPEQPLPAQGEAAPAAQGKQGEENAGEFFGIPVPMHNYYFIRSVMAVFGARDAGPLESDQEKEDYIWDHLLLSFEAFRRDIQATPEELDAEIAKILESEKAGFDRKQEPEKYAQWLKEKTGEPVELFESQVRHLIQVEKLRRQVRESLDPPVSDQEMFEEFLNEHNTLGVELVEFDERAGAEDFYRRAKRNARYWEAEKNKNGKKFRRPGFVSLEFLIDIWKIPRDTCYALMKLKAGELHPPAPIYKGFGVFKVLEKRPADEKEYGKLKDSYYNQIKRRKQFDGYAAWFKELKSQAGIKVYKQGGGKE
ncbi:MAG: hypothetical protein PHR11_04175 [Candidatus Omnitrophica bacterium]|nr:hypothetical protein [Candidatus Omnitrophota bacterium]